MSGYHWKAELPLKVDNNYSIGVLNVCQTISFSYENGTLLPVSVITDGTRTTRSHPNGISELVDFTITETITNVFSL